MELATRSKMFSRAANVAHPDFYGAPPNSLVDPIIAALPGTLPVINRRAVELAVMVGLALNCTIARQTKWDRKNYFYPDLPKGYQISQFDQPLCSDGELTVPLEGGGERRVRILRAHLEEDAGKLSHELPGRWTSSPPDGTFIDLNRAGTPLLEVVTHPDLTSAAEAVAFAHELRNICRFLGAGEGVMQRGHMRFEPNINLIITTDDGCEHATPIVEVKNLNSFKSLAGAIEYEQRRQLEQWVAHASGNGHAETESRSPSAAAGSSGRSARPGKTTRGWDDARAVTVLQRDKEEAHDYRYFPDPDLIPVQISDEWRERIAAQIPELPMQRRRRYTRSWRLTEKQALALTDDRDVCFFYEACVKEALQGGPLSASAASAASAGPGGNGEAGIARECALWLLNAGAKRAGERGCAIHELGITPKQIAQIIEMRRSDEIGSSAADELFAILCNERLDADARAVAGQRGMLQVRDEGQLEQWIDQAIAQQARAAKDFAAGKDAALGRLTGAVMKLSRGRADAKAVQARLRQRLRGEQD